MNDSKHRKERLEVGEGMNIDGPPPPLPVCRVRPGEAVGAERCLPFKCPSSVQPVREGRQCW